MDSEYVNEARRSSICIWCDIGILDCENEAISGTIVLLDSWNGNEVILPR
jgi:hypothetical protein